MAKIETIVFQRDPFGITFAFSAPRFKTTAPEASMSQTTTKTPQSQELFEVFRTVLEKWAFLPSEDIGPTVEGPAHLPLERMVGFSGPLEGFLVVRAPERFGKYLWENVSGEENSTSSIPHGDAFTEFVNLYFGHLLTGLTELRQGTFDPYLPQPSTPSLWPLGKPKSTVALLVEDMPVEIRLWIGSKAGDRTARG